MSKNLSKWFMVVFIAFTISLFAGCGDDDDDEGNDEGYVYITGTNPSGNGIEGTIVQCADKSTTTDRRGYYLLVDLPEGMQAITANALGYQIYSSSVLVTAEATVNHGIALTFYSEETVSKWDSMTWDQNKWE